MKTRVIIFLLLLLWCAGKSSGAIAESYAVTIKQLDVLGKETSAVCIEDRKCYLPLDLISSQGNTATLLVETLFSPGNVIFKFQISDRYFYVSEFEAASMIWWHIPLGMDQHVKKAVNLFLPTVPKSEINDPIQFPLNKVTDHMVSRLEIRIDIVQEK